MKSDQVDILASAVFRNLEQVYQTVEAGLTRELRGNMRKPDGLNGIDFDLAFVHRIAAADPDARTHPDANAAGDVAAPHAVAKTFREDHRGILQRVQQRHRSVRTGNICGRAPTSWGTIPHARHEVGVLSSDATEASRRRRPGVDVEWSCR